MKKNLLNLILSMTIFMSFLYSCKNAEVTPDDSSIAGIYKTINNPVLCALPSMTDVNIKANGSTFNMSFKNTNTAKNEEISEITVEKTDSTTKILRKGIEVGKYTHMKYLDYSGSSIESLEGKVLMLRFESDNKHYEFMGRK
jgi:hypothetical protein